MHIVNENAENAIENKSEPMPGRHYTALELVNANFPDPGGYLGGNHFNPGTLAMIAGMPGAGKSMIAMVMGERIASDTFFGPLATKRGNVLFVSEEMDERIPKKRLGRLFSKDQLMSLEDSYRFVFKPGFDLNEAPSRKALHTMVKEYGSKVVFLDCFTDCHRADENSNQEMAKWMGLVRDRTAIELGCCVVFIHHFRKHFGNEKDDIRGAQAIRAALSDLIYLTVDNDVPNTGLIKFDKVRDGAIRPPIRYGIEDGEDDSMFINFTEAA